MNSQSQNFTMRNIDWAVVTFRPLLQALHIQHIDARIPTVVYAKDFRGLVIKGMGRCILAVQRQQIPDDQQGYCTFIYRPKENVYILSIVIDEKLFLNDSLELRIQRKALGVHEFLHCVAIMMSLSSIDAGSGILIKNLKKSLDAKLKVTKSKDFTQLLKALKTITDGTTISELSLFNDKHFRTGYEEFRDDYAELYLNFLFSYALLLEKLGENGKDTLKTLLTNRKMSDLESFLQNLVTDIVESKALDKNFVLRRFRYFLPQLLFS